MIKKRRKITIVGAGNVGSTAALWAALKALGDVVLVDVVEGLPQGKALDLRQAAPIGGFDVNICGTQNYKDTADSDIVIITAGVARKPGMKREDLIKINAGIVKKVTEESIKYSPNAHLLVVSNPLDVMVYTAYKTAGLPRERVYGMAGVLDTTRFRTLLAEALNCSVDDVVACVLGTHGETMVPLPRYSTMAGIPITKLLSRQKINEIIERTRDGGAEIVRFLKTGSAFYAPSASVIEMAESVLYDQKRILPACSWLEGEYGLRDVCLGVPIRLGGAGVEEVIEIELEPDERESLHKAADAVKGMMREADKFLKEK